MNKYNYKKHNNMVIEYFSIWNKNCKTFGPSVVITAGFKKLRNKEKNRYFVKLKKNPALQMSEIKEKTKQEMFNFFYRISYYTVKKI